MQPAATVQPSTSHQQSSRNVLFEPQGGSGAADAAGVLTAVDEDEDGGEEAPLPREFDYYTSDDEGDEL